MGSRKCHGGKAPRDERPRRRAGRQAAAPLRQPRRVRHQRPVDPEAQVVVDPHVVHGRLPPHLAVLPLPFVGHEHADGHLLGFGIALPRDLGPAERRHAWGAAIKATQLRLGRLGLWQLVPEDREVPPQTLQPATWTATRGARLWATVSPVAFDRHPKAKRRDAYEREVAAMIAGACSRVGLPAPTEIGITRVSPHLGVPSATEFPRLRRKDGSQRRQVHAIIEFTEPVRGPILLGAGRYRGYGLCRPLGG